MSQLQNDTFLRALMRQPTEYTPMWMMRQAGRYLPEYCETRKRAGSFLQLCKSPSMACEVTPQPLARYELDAAILFSTSSPCPMRWASGCISPGRGAALRAPAQGRVGDPQPRRARPHAELQYVMDAVSEIRRALDGSVPLIGFSGSPGRWPATWSKAAPRTTTARSRR